MKKRILILVALVSLGLCLEAQTFLRVSVTRLGTLRGYDVHVGEMLTYKLKGDHFYHKARIMGMQDSSIIFENDKEITLNQIKSLRLFKNVHEVATLQTIFLWGSIGFIGLNTLNNVIIDTSPVFSEKAAYISAGLLATSLIIRELNLIRVKARKADFKVLSIDYEHLNVTDTK